MRPILLVPGYSGSGPDHWQSHWERSYPTAVRVEQRDWLRPERAEWVEALDRAVAEAEAPPVLAAHSLGCLAVVHWAAAHSRPVAGALLVAPPDVEQEDTPEVLRGFAPVPLRPLPFPGIVVASSDDPYTSLARARAFADAWRARWENVGRAGHINTASGLGRWPGGERLLGELLRAAGRAPR